MLFTILSNRIGAGSWVLEVTTLKNLITSLIINQIKIPLL